MSHTTTINSVPIRDTNALEKAVQDLKNEGVNCSLLRNATPRMYYQRQSDELKNSDYVLHLPDCKYDVAFVKQEDGTYSPAFDAWNNAVHGQIGASCPMPNTTEGKQQAAIGQLMQNYSKHAAMNAAISQGYMVDNSSVDEEGNVHLTLSV